VRNPANAPDYYSILPPPSADRPAAAPAFCFFNPHDSRRSTHSTIGDFSRILSATVKATSSAEVHRAGHRSVQTVSLQPLGRASFLAFLFPTAIASSAPQGVLRARFFYGIPGESSNCASMAIGDHFPTDPRNKIETWRGDDLLRVSLTSPTRADAEIFPSTSPITCNFDAQGSQPFGVVTPT